MFLNRELHILLEKGNRHRGGRQKVCFRQKYIHLNYLKATFFRDNLFSRILETHISRQLILAISRLQKKNIYNGYLTPRQIRRNKTAIHKRFAFEISGIMYSNPPTHTQ